MRADIIYNIFSCKKTSKTDVYVDFISLQPFPGAVIPWEMWDAEITLVFR